MSGWRATGCETPGRAVMITGKEILMAFQEVTVEPNEQQLWSLLAEHLRPLCRSWTGREYMERLTEIERLTTEELLERVVQQLADGDLDEDLGRAARRRRIDWEDVIASAARRLASLPLETLVGKARPAILAEYRERIGINNPYNQDTHPELDKIDEVNALTLAIGLKMLQGAFITMEPEERQRLAWSVGDVVLQHCHGVIIRACEEVLDLWGKCDWEELARRGLITPEKSEELRRDHPSGDPKDHPQRCRLCGKS
jgi:hypothetical protein